MMDKSRVYCQENVWKTCVICGDLQRVSAMRRLQSSCHLHIIVAYLKFAGYVQKDRDFSSYNDRRPHECFVCNSHADLPTKAFRKMYALPPEEPLVHGKCNPHGLIRALRKFMPPPFRNVTTEDFAEALPDPNLRGMDEMENEECTCCSLLEKTRSRLKTVIENSEATTSEVLGELIEIKKLLNVKQQLEKEDEDVKMENPETSTEATEAVENLLLEFEKSRARKRRREHDEENGEVKPIKHAPVPSRVHEVAKEILNSNEVIFETEDVRRLVDPGETALIHQVISHLESQLLIHTHIKNDPVPTCQKNLTVIYLKEFRRERLNELWNYRIIPEHYRQRLIGSSAEEHLQEQFQRYKDEFLAMDTSPRISGLVQNIFSCSPKVLAEFERLKKSSQIQKFQF